MAMTTTWPWMSAAKMTSSSSMVMTSKMDWMVWVPFLSRLMVTILPLI